MNISVSLYWKAFNISYLLVITPILLLINYLKQQKCV